MKPAIRDYVVRVLRETSEAAMWTEEVRAYDAADAVTQVEVKMRRHFPPCRVYAVAPKDGESEEG